MPRIFFKWYWTRVVSFSTQKCNKLYDWRIDYGLRFFQLPAVCGTWNVSKRTPCKGILFAFKKNEPNNLINNKFSLACSAIGQANPRVTRYVCFRFFFKLAWTKWNVKVYRFLQTVANFLFGPTISKRNLH